MENAPPVRSTASPLIVTLLIPLVASEAVPDSVKDGFVVISPPVGLSTVKTGGTVSKITLLEMVVLRPAPFVAVTVISFSLSDKVTVRENVPPDTAALWPLTRTEGTPLIESSTVPETVRDACAVISPSAGDTTTS